MMKRIKQILTMVFACGMAVFFSTSAAAAPYYSYIVDRDNSFRFSPPIYEPAYALNYDLNGIMDLCIDHQDFVYAAVTGAMHAEIVVFNAQGEYQKSLGQEHLQSANGVFVDANGLIYVADYAASKVIILDAQGEKRNEITKPDSPVYGAKTPFKPQKIAVDSQGSMYIISEGTTNGMVQLSADGTFEGFFGANLTKTSFSAQMQKLFLTPEMRAYFIKSTPPTMSNLSIDKRGLVYATTKGDTDEPVKKINIAGKNLLGGVLTDIYEESPVAEAVTVDKQGNIYVLTGLMGHVFILDSSGNYVGIFGGKSTLRNELGVQNNPVGIAVNSKHEIFIADKALGQIQAYQPTALMNTMFSALELFQDGRYVESESLWKEVLRRNSSVKIANKALGMSYYKQQENTLALDYFERANEKENYSHAFWEIRQQTIMQNAVVAMVLVISLLLLWKIYRLVSAKTHVLAGVNAAGGKLKNTMVCRQFAEVKRVLRQPRDVFYEMRYRDSVSTGTVAVLAVLALALSVLSAYTTGYLFTDTNLAFYSVFRSVAVTVVAVLLFVCSNYLVASIRDGEGKFLQVLKGTVVALTPFTFFTVPLILLSNILTLQETFIYSLAGGCMLVGCVILIFCMIMETHDYTPREAFANLLLTIFVMVIIFVVTVVIYMLAQQAASFFRALFEEVVN